MQPGLNFIGTTPILKGLNNTEKMLIFTRDEIRVSTVGQEHEITLVLKAQCIDIYKFALGYFYGSTDQFRTGISGCFLDSPATTSATVYRTMFAANDGGSCAVQNDNANTVSTLTLMEIAQ